MCTTREILSAVFSFCDDSKTVITIRFIKQKKNLHFYMSGAINSGDELFDGTLGAGCSG